jgi:hypothetical protein
VVILDRDRPDLRHLERLGRLRRGKGGLPSWFGKRKPHRVQRQCAEAAPRRAEERLVRFSDTSALVPLLDSTGGDVSDRRVARDVREHAPRVRAGRPLPPSRHRCHRYRGFASARAACLRRGTAASRGGIAPALYTDVCRCPSPCGASDRALPSCPSSESSPDASSRRSECDSPREGSKQEREGPARPDGPNARPAAVPMMATVGL